MKRVLSFVPIKNKAMRARAQRWAGVCGVLIVVAVLGITLIAGVRNQEPASAARTPLDVGVIMHPLWTSAYTDAEQRQIIDKMVEAKVRWIRIDVGWINIFPNNNTTTDPWSLGKVDNVVNYANSKGMKVLMIWWLSPAWANGNKAPEACPNNVADYAKSAQWAANYWKGKVQAFEVWNEPDPSQSFWQCGSTAAIAQDKYVELLKAAYPAFHAGNPDVKVVLAGPASNDDVWLRGIYTRGGKNFFDVMSTHPYQAVANEPPELPDNGKWRFTHLPAVVNMMKEFGDENKEFWFTEFGYSTHDQYSSNNWEQGVTEQQQGDYFVRAVQYAHDNFPTVTNIFWYAARNETSGSIHLQNYGMLKIGLAPKLGYTTLKNFLTTYYTATPPPTPTPTPPPPTPTPPPPTPTPPPPTPTPSPLISQTNNLLNGKTFTSSAANSTTEPGNPPSTVNDKNETTRWISTPTDNTTLSTDLGASYTLNKVSVLWAGNTIRNYEFQVSANNTNWTTIATGATNNTQSYLTNTTSFTGTPTGRYFRILAKDRWVATFGNSVYEIGVYGTAVSGGTPGDANGDGQVNAIDLSALISHDGQSYPAADFNGDGTCGAADLAILLGRWTW